VRQRPAAGLAIPGRCLADADCQWWRVEAARPQAFSGCGRAAGEDACGGIGIAVSAWDAIALASGRGLACAGELVVAVRECRGRGRWW
jgi:hypothetical protein